jgi:hypothetical protein
MRVAYADPPYLGCGKKIYAPFHPDAADFDDPETHRKLVEHLCSDYEAWALSLHTPSLQVILPMCPPDVRVGAWVKPFCSFKPNVNPAYAWEPVVFRGCRKRDRWEPKVRDYASVGITLKAGFPGAKPAPFCWWIFDMLGLHVDDDLVDLFPGSGAVSRAWDEWKRAQVGILFPMEPAR